MIPKDKEARLSLTENADMNAASCDLLCWAKSDGADIRIETGGDTKVFVVNADWCTAHGSLTFPPHSLDLCPLPAAPNVGTIPAGLNACDVNNCPRPSFTVTVTPPSDQSWINGKTITAAAATATTNDPDAGTTFTWAVSPALPAGVTLNTGTGAITGKPTAVKTQTTYTLTATDTKGNTGTGTFKATVAASVVTVAAVADQTWTSGTAITNVTPSASDTNGETSFTWSISPALPAAVTLNTSTGVISGTPAAAAAQTSYTITATDSTGSTGTKSFNVTVS